MARSFRGRDPKILAFASGSEGEERSGFGGRDFLREWRETGRERGREACQQCSCTLRKPEAKIKKCFNIDYLQLNVNSDYIFVVKICIEIVEISERIAISAIITFLLGYYTTVIDFFL